MKNLNTRRRKRIKTRIVKRFGWLVRIPAREPASISSEHLRRMQTLRESYE